MPYGPNEESADKLALPGKQLASAVSPAGVGVRLSEEKTVFCEIISWSNPPKKNTLFLATGPPMVNPPNSSLSRGGSFKPWNCFSKLLIAFRTELLIDPKTLPCQTLPPDLVMTLTTEPELRPYSGPN